MWIAPQVHRPTAATAFFARLRTFCTTSKAPFCRASVAIVRDVGAHFSAYFWINMVHKNDGPRDFHPTIWFHPLYFGHRKDVFFSCCFLDPGSFQARHPKHSLMEHATWQYHSGQNQAAQVSSPCKASIAFKWKNMKHLRIFDAAAGPNPMGPLSDTMLVRSSLAGTK